MLNQAYMTATQARGSGFGLRKGSQDKQSQGRLPTQLLMRPLKQYLEPGSRHMQRGLGELCSASLKEPQNSILNPNLTVKGGGGGLISTITQKRAKTLKPKGTWVSPFQHRATCKQNKKNNLVLN